MRDCSSDIDNDCNGVVDRLETTCQCIPGTTRSCGTAACAASETCVLSPDRGSSSFAACALASETMPDPVLAALVRSRRTIPQRITELRRPDDPRKTTTFANDSS